MITVIAGIIALGWILAFSSPDAMQLKALHSFDDEKPYIVLNHEEIHAKFNSRYPGIVSVEPGLYLVPRPHQMPVAEWCYRHPDHTYIRDDSTCIEVSERAAEEMDGYAFGFAYDLSFPDNPGHMQNVLLVDDGGDVKIAFYDMSTCYFTDEPHEIDRIIIGGEYGGPRREIP